MTFSDLLIPVAIGVIMFGIGLTLSFRDFVQVVLKPRAMLTGLSAQMIFLPGIAFLLAWVWNMDPIHKLGLVLIAACPGGSSSNLITHLLKGRVALSVSLTALNSILILFTIPTIVGLGALAFMGEQRTIDMSFWGTFREIFYTVILPVLSGILVNEVAPPRFIERMRKPLKYILPGVLLLIMAVALLGNGGAGKDEVLNNPELFIPAVLLNIVTTVSGYLIAWIAGVGNDGRYTIAIEVGLQNSGLAIFIANTVMGVPALSALAVIYASFSFFTTFGMGYVLKRMHRSPAG